MRFLVITNAPTLKKDEKYVAYAPYVKEMDLWFKNVKEVGIISPATYPECVFEKAFVRQDFKFFKLPFLTISSPLQIIRFLFLIPILQIEIIKSFIWADHIHLRGPGNISLLGCFLQIFFPHKPKTAKYAGNWDPNANQPWSYKLQKWILSNTFLTRNMTVLVYGNWGGQTKNIVPFFTASFSEKERELIVKDISAPYKFLFMGNLVQGKQPEIAIMIVEKLNKRNIQAELHIYGDGEMRVSLQEQAENKAYIHLHGNQPLEILKKAYKDAHFLILASKSEGWPKAVAEAMWFGCIPIATAVSCVPWMLGEGSRGILVSDGNIRKGNPVDSGLLDTFQKSRQFECFPETADALSENVSRTGCSETLEVTENGNVLDDTVGKIIELINQPEEMKRRSMDAQEWSQEYTLERFEEEIKKLLAPQPPKGEQKK